MTIEAIVPEYPIEQQVLPLHAVRSTHDLHEATKGFESLFIQKLMQVMNEDLGKNDILYSKQEAMWRSMLHEEYAKEIAHAGGIGLADMLYEYLAPLVLQEQEQSVNTAKARASYQESYPMTSHSITTI